MGNAIIAMEFFQEVQWASICKAALKERKKFKIEPKNITPELITAVNQRDKNCVYCGKVLPDKPANKNDVHYDHLHPFKPFSKINMVRCCGSCNHQKSNGEVLEWCKHKGYTPAKIVYDLFDSIIFLRGEEFRKRII